MNISVLKFARVLIGRASDSFVEKLCVFSPKLATKYHYWKRFRKKLDLVNPKTLNEKVLWLKLYVYYNNKLVKQCADKYAVREYVISKGCQEILNDLYFVCERVDQIPWHTLPSKYVIKCNHGSGYNIICSDSNSFDKIEASKVLRKWLNEEYWMRFAETNYRSIKKKVICEKYLGTNDGKLPEDYKVYCFNGVAECVMVCTDRELGHPKFFYFNRNWEMLNFSQDAIEYGQSIKITKPEGIADVFRYAEILAEPFPFVRVDFYLINGQVIFGELTFTPSAGLDSSRLKVADDHFGELLALPKGKGRK